MEPITCNECGEAVWCIRFEGVWVCKECFLGDGNSIQEWDEINSEGKRRREEKKRRLQQTEGGYHQQQAQDYDTPTKQKARPCKYGCGTMLIWDTQIQDKNKFKDAQTGELHTFEVCKQTKEFKKR